jgi:hypothetical protein
MSRVQALDTGRRKDPGTLGTLYHLKRIELVRDESRNELLGELRKESFEHYELRDVVRLLAVTT